VFENERYIPIKGWGSGGHLLPTDKRRYSGRNLSSRGAMQFPFIHLPPGARGRADLSVVTPPVGLCRVAKRIAGVRIPCMAANQEPNVLFIASVLGTTGLL
jgi:hypothetical protein